MSRRKKRRADGTPVPRSVRPPPVPPSAKELEALDKLTDELPEEIRAFRDLALIGPERRHRLECALRWRTRSLVLVLDGVHDPHNQAAVMRTSEALGLQELHLVRRDRAPLQPSERVTQHADKWIDVVVHDDAASAIAHLRGRGMRLLATALGKDTEPLYEVDFRRPTAIFVGNEAKGLPDEILEACDGRVEIPIYGLSQSLNVSVAAAVILATAVESRRAAWQGAVGDLTESERMALRRRFYRAAAGKRIPPKLLEKLDALE